MKNKMKNILFVCKNNRFRSRVARAYFNKINKNKEIKAESAGLIGGTGLNRFQVAVTRKFGINIKGRPRGLTDSLLLKQDLIIIVADDVPKLIFKKYIQKFNKKVIVWKIRDTDEKKKAEGVIKRIMKRVEQLNKKLSRKSGKKK